MDKDNSWWKNDAPVEQSSGGDWWKADKPVEAPKRTRGVFEATNDLVIEGANAAAGAVSSLANMARPGNRVSSFIDENIIQAGEAKQSDVVRAEKQAMAQGIQDADGIGGELKAVGKYALNNPLLAAAQAAGSFVVPGAAAKTLGLIGGIGAGAALAGGDAAGSAYELSSKAGATDEQALSAGRQASVIPSIVGGVTGAFGAERLLAGGKGFSGGLVSRALKTGASEAGQEAIEEGVTQYEGQRAAMPYDASIDPAKGVAGAAGMGAILGGATGAGVSLIAGGADPRMNPNARMPQEPVQPDPIDQPDAINPIDSPDAGIDVPIKPSEAMGINPNAGALSKVAAMAVDTGVTQQVQAEQIAAQVAASEEKSAGLKEKASGQAVPEENSIDPLTAQPEAPVPMEARSMDELRQALRNAQDPTIRKTVAAEIRRRRESMPDPLSQQQQEPTSVVTPAQSFQTSSEESKAQPAAAPAVLGQSLTEAAGVLDRGTDPLQSFIESENNARRANEGLRSTPATSTGQRIDQPSASMGTAVAGVRSGGNDATDAKPAANGDAGSGTGSAGAGVSALTPKEWADRETAPVGSWVKADYKLQDSQPLYQVRELDPKSLFLPELDDNGRLQPEKRKYLAPYAERAKAGEKPPAITVIEMEDGRMRVVDGNRRVMAAIEAGSKNIKALVSPLVSTPDGKKEASVELLPATTDRPPRWRQNALQAGKVARTLGLDPKGKRLAQIVAEIDAVEAGTNVQNTPQGTAGKAEAAPVEASKAARGDDAAAGGVPATRQDAGVRADGVAAPEAFKSLLNKKSTKVLSDDGRGRVLYEVDVPAAFRIKHFVNGRLPSVEGLELKDKASVTGNPSDNGYVLIDNRKQLESRKPAAPGAGDVQADGVKTIAQLRKAVEDAPPISMKSVAAIRKLRAAVTKDAETALSQGVVPVYVSTTGVTLAITPSAQREGMFQVTRYNNTGAVGDSQYKSVADAVEDNQIDEDRLPAKDAEAHMQKLVEAEAKYQQSRKDRTAAKAPAPEPEKAAPVPAKKPYDRASSLRKAEWRKNPLRSFLGQHGLSIDLAKEFAPGITERRKAMVGGYGPIFRKSGKNIDLLAEIAREEGFISADQDATDLYELIAAVFRGERVAPMFTADAAQDEMQARMDAMQEQSNAEFEDFIGMESTDPFGPLSDDEITATGYDAADDKIKAEVDALIAMADSLGIDTETIREDAARETAEQSEQVYYVQARRILTQAIAQSTGSSGNNPVGETRQGQREETKPRSNADRGTGTGSTGEQSGLTAPTRKDIEAQQDRTEQAEKAKIAADKAADAKAAKDRERSDIKRMSESAADTFELGGDAMANLTGQQDVFGAAQPERFEAGKILTKEQRKTVLASLVDVYKQKGADRELKGVDKNGNERYGYVHSPDLFEKSDITGSMVRYYVTMPDGRMAHPTELFPDYTQSDIDSEMQRRKNAEKRNRQTAREYYLEKSGQFGTKREAAEYWNEKSDKSSRTASGKPTIFDALEREFLTDGKKFVMVPETLLKNEEMMEAIRAEGWDVVKATAEKSAQPKVEKPAKTEQPTQADQKAGEAPDAKTAPKPETLLEAHKSLQEKINNGTATVEEYQAGFNSWQANKEAIVSEYMAMKKDDLLAMISGYYRSRYKGETKAATVDALWRDGLQSFTLGRSLQYSMGRGAMEQAVKTMVDATDADQLATHAAEVKAAREERIAQKAKIADSVKDPKTPEDIQTLMAVKVRQEGMTFKDARMSLTPEQRAMYDEFIALESRSKRKESVDSTKSVRVAGQKVDAQIIATKHTQKGHDLFVVQLAERVSREDYETLNTSAKRMGGYYSSFKGRGAIAGFQFKDKATADAFVQLANGDSTQAQEAATARRDAFADDRSQTAVERLNEMADKLEESADNNLNADRKVNTDRRARFAARAEAAANSNKAFAKTMRNIAAAIEGGKVKFLDRVRQKTQVAALFGFVKTAQDAELRAKYPVYADQEKHKGAKPTMETADNAEFPSYSAYRSDLASLGRQLLEVDGTKLLGQRIMKVADDVSDAFNKFAKENTGKLMAYRTKDGGVAGFGSKADAERSIAMSGFRGKALPYMVKRGEYTIILSPSEAIARGIWNGDGDKRITLTPDFGAELVEKIGKAARRGSKVSVPWQFESAHDKLKLLARMGIETPAEFRSALREFIAMQEQDAPPDKVKALERSMVGRKNDGMDFFPTPQSVADEMVEAAGIEDGMSVLEPSAGWGHIAERIRESGADPDVIELSGDRRELLEAKGFNVVGSDFMDMTGQQYDRIVMNPPFSDRRDAEHVRHAYTLLKPGGRVVAIMGEGVFFGSDKKAQDFRDWLDSVGGTDEKLPAGSFMDPSLPVNTGVSARMVVIEKPAGDSSQQDDTANYGTKDRGQGTPTDRAVMDMAGDQRSADEILSFIAASSKSPFNRQIARMLIKTGANPAVSLGGEMGGGAGFKFLAKYSRKDHEVTLSEAAAGKAEQIFLHETVHAATLLALDKGGLMATQMNRLYEQVKANGAAQGQYGLKNVGEFVAEAFTNKEFQAMLKGIKVPGGSVWERFVNMVRRVLGMSDTSTNALSKALELGAEVMRENMPLRAARSFRAEDGPAYLGAWHGSPHKFDKFTTDKMGTGEGAQAYGWGLYFTSKKEIAEYYRTSLAKRDIVSVRGKDLDQQGGFLAAHLRNIKMDMQRGKTFDAAKQQAIEDLSYRKDAPDETAAAIKELEKLGPNDWKAERGQLYSVEIPEETEMLLWDKPLSEQPAKVRDALESRNMLSRRMTGEQLYKSLKTNPMQFDGVLSGRALTQANIYPDQGASMFLSALGIKGIKYLDGTSRTSGDGSYNYVVFSGDDVSITDTAYMGTKDQTETEAFKKWFAGSKVVTPDGKPLVVYRSSAVDSVLSGEPQRPESGMDGLRGNAELVANLLQGPTFRLEGLRGFDAPTQRVVLAAVRGFGLDSKVLRSVVDLVPVDVVNVLAGQNLSPESLFSDEAVLKNLLSVNSDRPVTAAVDVADALVSAVTGMTAKAPGVSGDGVGSLLDGGSASGTGEVNVFLSTHGGKLQAVDATMVQQKSKATGNRGNFDPEDADISHFGEAEDEAWGAPEKSKFDDLIYKLQDKQIDTKRVVESIKATAGDLADAKNVYLQEELFHGRAAARTEDFVNKELAPLINMMRMRGIEIADLDEYLHARHAEEANELIAKRNKREDEGQMGLDGKVIESPLQDGGSGMTTKAAREYLAKLAPAEKAKLEAVAAKVDAILGTTRQLYADYNLESQDTVSGWGKMFDHYVPLMREDKDGGMGIGQGFSVKGKEVKGRTGSTRKVVDILANIAMQRERAIVRGEKNRVAAALVGLAKANPNNDFWHVGPPPMHKVYDPVTDSVVERVDPLYKSRDNAVVAKLKTKKGHVVEQVVMFNEDNERAMRMAAALKNLDAAGLEGLLGVSAKITRYFAAINTQYNPIFGAVNLVRDVQGALFNLTSTPLKGKAAIIGKNTLSALKGIYMDARSSRDGKTPTSAWAKLWEEFQNEGGQTGFRDLFTNSADRAKAIEHELNPTKWMDSPLGQVFTAKGALKVPLTVAQKKATGFFGWLSDYNLAMENAVRLSAYKAALDQGMSKQRAASLAKNLTVNFNRKGQVGQQAGALYAFFNASMQGTARLGETLFDMEPGKPKTIRLSNTGKKIVYGGVMLGVMQTLMLAAAGFDEDEPPEFVRERSLIIPTGGNSYITIPMPLGLHVLPNIGRIPAEFAMGGFKDPAQAIEKLLVLVSGAFNPIGGGASLVQMLAPTAIDPMVAISENKDWTGKPIAKTSYNQAIPGHLLTKDTASAPAKMLAEAINIMSGGTEYTAGVLSPTPDQIDYLFGQVTGGVGREVSKLQQSGTAMVTGEDLPIHKVPLVGRFYGDTDTQSAQSGKFYSAINKLNIHEQQIKGLRKDGRGAEVAEYMRKNPEARLFMAANAAEREVQKLRGIKRDMVKDGAPADQVKAIEQRINDRMTRFNEAVKRLREQENG